MDKRQSGPESETVIGDVANVAEWTEADALPAVAEPPLAVGSIIRERFELEAIIGQGSTGVVYRALDRLHVEMQDRDPYVAIKVLRKEFGQHSRALMTLQREVRKAQTLAHENIISVHSFEREGANVFMTMELLHGRSLRDVIAERRGGLPAEEGIPMIQAMARALAYAHDNDYVHSDFSPGNVFLTARGQIKVLDFGVARGTARPSAPDGGHEPEYFDGARGMTPAYASPQMLNGEDPEPSDDVFALAIVAYELLSGRHPFDHGPADASRARSLKIDTLPGLTRSQRKALARAFSPERETRHASAREFLEEFSRSRAVRAVAIGSFLGIAVIGVLAVAALRDTGPRPEVPLENLADDVRADLRHELDEGWRALELGDVAINDAYQHFSNAFDLHRYNEEAMQGLRDVADRLLSSIRTADVGTQRGAFELLACQEYLATYRPAAVLCPELLGAECAAIANRCGG